MNTVIKSIKELKNRPTWDEYFMTTSYLIAQRSTCDRLHVGCIIVKNNRIIATGYNGFIAGAPHVGFIRDNHEQLTIHAETNAVADSAKRGNTSLEGSTAYVTHCPCINCCKILVAAGIKKIIYCEDYKTDELVFLLCERGNVEITKIEKILLESEQQKIFGESSEKHPCLQEPKKEQLVNQSAIITDNYSIISDHLGYQLGI